MSENVAGLLRRIVSPPKLNSLLLHVVAVAIALAIAIVVLLVIVLAYGESPGAVLSTVASKTFTVDKFAAMLNKGTTYYLAGLAAAIGFRMFLFNIGIDGQYRLGVFTAAIVGSAVALPGVLQVPLLIVVAMAVAGLFATIPAYLKASRGVSEVISTIMLNSVATGAIAYLLKPERFGVGGVATKTKDVNPSSTIPNFQLPGQSPNATGVYGFVLIAIVVGVIYWIVTERTSFGFELTASGTAPRAALLGGTNPRRMIVTTMILSGAMAGLIGLPELMGPITHSYGQGFPSGLAWVGLSIAILGRNHPVGILFGALLWVFLETAAKPLPLYDIPTEVIAVIQAVVVLAVVTSYEFVHRVSALQARRRAASFAVGPVAA